jgi:hypothetical protein
MAQQCQTYKREAPQRGLYTFNGSPVLTPKAQKEKQNIYILMGAITKMKLIFTCLVNFLSFGKHGRQYDLIAKNLKLESDYMGSRPSCYFLVLGP